MLWQIYQKEKYSNELQTIPKSFYDEIKKDIELLESKNPNDDEASIIKNNIIKITNELYEKRKQKIIIYAAYNKPLPSPIPKPEQDFYIKLINVTKENKVDISGRSAESGAIALRAIIEIPEVFLPSGSKIGPVQKGSVLEIENANDAKFLIENTLCEQA
ncbi:MAG: hypothetical protein M1128_02400 [Candidatus Marsarchaeota archaeon]|nr:hypothetical protein [Candidatus Marsarchaeota archaeon]